MAEKSNNLKSKIFSGLFWRFGERIVAQLVSFMITIILSRILGPSEYGAIALTNVFIIIANVFVVSGFGNALIQKKDADNLDFSSVFYFNIVFSLFLYMILFISAPSVAVFYEMPVLKDVLRVLGVIIVIAGINSVQQAYVSRHMLFKRFFWSTLFGTLLSGIVGVVMAFRGYGIWALVAQILTNSIVDTLILWFTVKWRPDFAFSLKRMITMFHFGWKILCSGLLDTGYNQLQSLVIGKMYSSSDLAFYNRGQQYPNLIVTNINTSISSVLFPAIAREQDNRVRVKAMTRRAIKTSAYIMWPMMIGLGVVAEPLISIMLTDKWLPCVPYLQIACFIYGFWPIHTANLEAMKALGKSNLYLRLEIIKKSIGFIVLILVMRHGVMTIALSFALTTIISSFINAYPNKGLLDYGYFEQIKDMIPALFLSALMGVIIYPLRFLINNNFMLLGTQIILGVLIYLMGSKIFKFESFQYLLDTIKKILQKKK